MVDIYVKEGHLFSTDMSRIYEGLFKKGNVIQVVFPPVSDSDPLIDCD